jgi:beta-N-acetylhexosaminidase
MKHVPGHGRARVDSHLELPTVDAAPEDLARIDFAPFQALADLPMAMTAHVVYAHLDADHPATISPTIVRSIIRGAIGFDGLLLTDDLSMKALGGAFRDRAEAAFAAGVDIALHCNGVMEEARPVAEASPRLEGKALDRARAALARITAPLDFDAAEARARLDRAMARTAAA